MPGDSGPADAAESQMRRALGLLGETSRNHKELERMEPNRMGGVFGGGGGGGGGNGGLHRRRFVQDGDIPVTVLRREPGFEQQPAYRSAAAPAAPTSSRLQRTEAALAAETAAREKAERSLADAQFAVRDLQTKIGHAELAKNEAIEALRRERESIGEVRANAEAREEQLAEALEEARHAEEQAHTLQTLLAEERHARKAAEKALRIAEAARDAAEELVEALTEAAQKPAREPVRVEPVRIEPVRAESPRRARGVAEPEVVPVAPRRGRPPSVAVVADVEPEPVKWWLNAKPAVKKR